MKTNAESTVSTIQDVVRSINGATAHERRQKWLEAVAVRTAAAHPALGHLMKRVLGVEPQGPDVLAGLTIGEIGACYEALLADSDTESRKSEGQFFTPDDVARFMARSAATFGLGTWIDPCCGVGNLSWHLADSQQDPARFVREHLILVDSDATALRSAVALIAATFLEQNDAAGLLALHERSVQRDYLSPEPLPSYDFAILNPPYAKTSPRAEFITGNSGDLFALFMERVATTSLGFVSVTSASYLSSTKFQSLRTLLDQQVNGGDVFVFDNMPDTLFRGYKFGSSNTSVKNCVRAAITVAHPSSTSWRVTPILRWCAADRALLLDQCPDFLAPRREGPHGEWAKVALESIPTWDALMQEKTSLRDLVSKAKTPYWLEVAMTPRYFISAAFRTLRRTSKTTLYFKTAEDRDWAAVILNSSIPYLWWRALDGGVTLPMRVLLSVPMMQVDNAPLLAEMVRTSEQGSVVSKLNAGKPNENIKHPRAVVEALNAAILPVPWCTDSLYASSMVSK